MKDHTKISKFIEFQNVCANTYLNSKLLKNRKNKRECMVLGDAVFKPHTFSLIFAAFKSLLLSKYSCKHAQTR
jgi:hypothetical protein